MNKGQRAPYLDLVKRLDGLGTSEHHFYGCLCNICRYRAMFGDELECLHPIINRMVDYGEELFTGAVEARLDCWLFRPRVKCKTVELAEAWIRAGNADYQEDAE